MIITGIIITNSQIEMVPDYGAGPKHHLTLVSDLMLENDIIIMYAPMT